MKKEEENKSGFKDYFYGKFKRLKKSRISDWGITDKYGIIFTDDNQKIKISPRFFSFYLGKFGDLTGLRLCKDEGWIAIISEK